MTGTTLKIIMVSPEDIKNLEGIIRAVIGHKIQTYDHWS